ncbi:MAG TPA: hypothetical protein VGX23_01590 [Actinocrinis sp.]|nr:hypothetical protein [Actinocrinis sp.]
MTSVRNAWRSDRAEVVCFFHRCYPDSEVRSTRAASCTGSPSSAITVMASNRLVGAPPRRAAPRRAGGWQLLLELGDAPPGRDQLGVLAAGDARRLAGVDQVLAAPVIDGLVADAEHLGDLLDRPGRLSRPFARIDREMAWQTALPEEGTGGSDPQFGVLPARPEQLLAPVCGQLAAAATTLNPILLDQRRSPSSTLAKRSPAHPRHVRTPPSAFWCPSYLPPTSDIHRSWLELGEAAL